MLTLTVTDDGDGLPAGYAPGTGMRGMRERATLIGAASMIDRNPGGPRLPTVRLEVPVGERAMTPLKTRVLLADDHALVRRGLRLVLDAEPDLEVVAETGDGAEAVQRALEPEVDLAILDISMPRMTGPAGGAGASPPPPRAAHPDAVDAPERAIPVRGAEGRRIRIRAEDGRRSRPGRGLPGRDARREVPVPRGDDAADP